MSADSLIVLVSQIIFAVPIVAIIYTMLRKVRPRPRGFLRSLNDGPLLSSSQLLENKDLLNVFKGQIRGYKYSLLTNRLGRVMLYVTLPRSTGIHVVGIGSKSGFGSQLMKPRMKSNLTQLDLEGDFPNDFKMYCSPGKELELLRIFDPSDMAYFADFCRAYDFELFHDSIYISQAEGARDTKDSTTLVKDAEEFIERNEKLLQRFRRESAKTVH